MIIYAFVIRRTRRLFPLRAQCQVEEGVWTHKVTRRSRTPELGDRMNESLFNMWLRGFKALWSFEEDRINSRFNHWSSICRQAPERKCVTTLTPQEIMHGICEHFYEGEDELSNHSQQNKGDIIYFLSFRFPAHITVLIMNFSPEFPPGVLIKLLFLL